MCNKPAFFIIDAASQEVLLVSELTLANAAQTENNGATLVPIKTSDPRTQTADSDSSKTLTVDPKHYILTHRTRTEPESLTCCHPMRGNQHLPSEKKEQNFQHICLKVKQWELTGTVYLDAPLPRKKKKTSRNSCISLTGPHGLSSPPTSRWRRDVIILTSFNDLSRT